MSGFLPCKNRIYGFHRTNQYGSLSAEQRLMAVRPAVPADIVDQAAIPISRVKPR